MAHTPFHLPTQGNNYPVSNQYSSVNTNSSSFISPSDAQTILGRGDSGSPALYDVSTGALSSPMDSAIGKLPQTGINVDALANNINKGTTETPGFFNDIFSDEYKMGNIAGLASTLMQAVSLPEMMKNARLQNKALRFNLDTAKQEQNRRNKNIASFNNPSAPTSALA